MESTLRTQLATDLFNKVKNNLLAIRNWNKENNNPYTRKPQFVELGYEEVTSSVYNPNTKLYENSNKSYDLYFEGKTAYKGLKTLTEVGEVFAELIRLLNKQKEVKGWGGLVFDVETDRKGYGGHNWCVSSVRIVRKVTLADAPCKEYKSLQNYLNKYGWKKVEGQWGMTHLELGNYRLFSARMGGKRGYLWDEYGERVFLDNKPKKCATILAELRKFRTAKDTMICVFGEEDYMDAEERRYSSYHELECEGEKRRYLNITIETPKGAVKYQRKIY